MKNCFFCALLASVAFTAAGAPTNQDRWCNTPFSGGFLGTIWKAVGTGNRMWFFTDSALGTCDLSTMKAQVVARNTVVRDIWPLAGDQVLMRIRGGRESESFQAWPNTPRYLIESFDGAYDAAVITQGGTIVAAGFTSSGVRAIFSYTTTSKQFVEFKNPDPLTGTVTVMMEGPEGKIWMATDSGKALYCFNGTSIAAYPFDKPTNVYNMLRAADGRLLFVADTALLSIRNDSIIATKTIDSVAEGRWSIIDKNDNVWHFSKSGGQKRLNKVPLDASQTAWGDTVSLLGPMFSCDGGIGAFNGHEFRFRANGGSSWSTVSLDEGWWNLMGINLQFGVNSLLFRKNGSIVINPRSEFRQDVPAYYSFGSRRLYNYDKGVCSPLPDPPCSSVTSLEEKSDGVIIAITEEGKFAFNGSTWDTLRQDPPAVLDGVVLDYYAKDGKGRYWKAFEDHILLHENGTWKWLDSMNSNFPFAYWMPYDIVAFPESAHGKDGRVFVWIGPIYTVSTVDGYHWTPDSLHYTEVYRGSEGFSDDQGHWVNWILTEKSGSAPEGEKRLHATKYVFNGSQWAVDRQVDMPVDYGNFWQFQEDNRGDLWLKRNTMGAEVYSSYYRYSVAASAWIRYDSTNAPFTKAEIIGEDTLTGKMYIQTYDQNAKACAIYFLDRGTVGVTTATVGKPIVKGAPLFALRGKGKGIEVRFSIAQDCDATLAVYSLQGRLVQTLVSGLLKRGAYTRSFYLHPAPGMYFVRLKTPEGMHAEKVLVR
jgi:hypothetical protein